MIRKLGILCVTLASLLLLASSVLLARNFLEAERARLRSEEAIVVLELILEETAAAEPPAPGQEPAAGPMPEAPPVETALQDQDMTQAEIDGHSYIGYLSIPVLGLELPVMADWDNQKLQIAPCRYFGSIAEGNLVLTAHNYYNHFGNIHRLLPGDELSFTDMDQLTTCYRVAAVEVIEPTEVEKVTANDHDLTLFTCTYGGHTRFVVYCDGAEP